LADLYNAVLDAVICGELPSFWLNLQSAYELRLAEQAAGPEIVALPVMPD